MPEKTGKLPDVDVVAVLDRVFQCDGRLDAYVNGALPSAASQVDTTGFISA